MLFMMSILYPWLQNEGIEDKISLYHLYTFICDFSNQCI